MATHAGGTGRAKVATVHHARFGSVSHVVLLCLIVGIGPQDNITRTTHAVNELQLISTYAINCGMIGTLLSQGLLTADPTK